MIIKSLTIYIYNFTNNKIEIRIICFDIKKCRYNIEKIESPLKHVKVIIKVKVMLCCEFMLL